MPDISRPDFLEIIAGQQPEDRIRELLGRGPELTALAGLLREADADGGVRLVTGEPGMGKTVLALTHLDEPVLVSELEGYEMTRLPGGAMRYSVGLPLGVGAASGGSSTTGASLNLPIWSRIALVQNASACVTSITSRYTSL